MDDLNLLQKVCNSVSFNIHYVELKNKPFVNLVYQINDKLNILARKKLRGLVGIEKDDIDNAIKHFLGYQTKELRACIFQLVNLYPGNPDIFLQIYQNSSHLYYLGNVFREFAYPPLENKSDRKTSSTYGGILSPKPVRRDATIGSLDDLSNSPKF